MNLTSRFLRLGRRGVAVAEFAVVAPVMVLLLLGTVDVANMLQTSIRLERAARAGAQFAVARSSDMEAIRSRVIAAWPELTSADVPLPVVTCECAAAVVACGNSCPSGLMQILSVTANRTLSPRLLHSMNRGTGNAIVRLR